MSDVVIENSPSPVPALSLATPDNLTIIGSGIHGDPLRAVGLGAPISGPAALTASTNLLPASVIAPGSAPGTARPAKADGSALGNAIGIVTAPTGTLEAEAVEYSLIAGLLSLAGAIWDGVTGDTGGLVQGDVYYLSQATAGALTNARPGSGQVVQIGTAISTTTMALGSGQPSTPGGGGAPSVQRVSTVANHAAANPATDVTFVTTGGDADAAQVITLANGAVDGFEKTVMIETGVPVAGWTVAPASGPTVAFPNAAGAVTYRWNATAVAWQTQSAHGSL